MEPPEASSQSGLTAMVSRSAEAIRSGLVVAIGGVPVRLQALDARRAGVVSEFLYGLEPVSTEPVCTVTFGEAVPSLPSRPYDDAVCDGEAWQRDTAFAFRHESGVVAVAGATTAHIGGDADELWWPFRRLFHPVIAHLLAHQHRYVLHAAAIADGRGAVLVFGGSGAGKSTTAMAALRAGWQVMGDDATVLVPGDGAADVVGIARPMAVPGDVFDGLGPHGVMPGDMRTRVELPPHRLASVARPVSAIVISDHAHGGDATIERVSPADVVREALSAFTPARNLELRRAYFPHATELSRLPAWRLRHASDPSARLSAAAELLAGVHDFEPSDQS
jgi:hypothetical protein